MVAEKKLVLLVSGATGGAVVAAGFLIWYSRPNEPEIGPPPFRRAERNSAYDVQHVSEDVSALHALENRLR